MCWVQRLQESAEWTEQQWNALSSRTQELIREMLSPGGLSFLEKNAIFYVDLAIHSIVERLWELAANVNHFENHPEELGMQFLDYILPGTRFGDMARLLRPGSEPIFGLGDELIRPIILVPGMVGTRLFRTEDAEPVASRGLPPDRVASWMELQLRSDDSVLLRDLPTSVRDVLRPALSRISDHHLYNPATIWDPDSPHAMVHLMNKTASERGAIFCAEDTPGGPATEFAVEVAESMTLRGLLSIWYGPGPRAERLLREVVAAFDGRGSTGRFEDRQFAELRQRRLRRGWSQPVWQVSKDWLLPLERTFGEVVYAFGYDWREPLEQAVTRLVQKIERVKRHHRGLSPILVTHSFGGLVSQAAARRRPENVAGIVQVFSPAAGSVKMFTNFKKGGGGSIPPGWDSEIPPDQTALEDFFTFDSLSTLLGFDVMDACFGILLGWDEVAFAVSCCGSYGAYSLLPNNLPRFRQGSPWLKIEDEPSLAGMLASSRNVYDLYRQFDRPWGLLDGNLWSDGNIVTTGELSERAWQWLGANAGQPGSFVRFLHSLQSEGILRMFTRETLTSDQVQRVRERVIHGLQAAERLNTSVGAYVHPNTWSIYGSGLDTDVGFNIRRTDSSAEPFATHRIVSGEGDGSLEVASARALSRRLHTEIHLSGVKHADAMEKSADARHALLKSVYLAMVAAHRASNTGSTAP